jgi:hypothetical protein
MNYFISNKYSTNNLLSEWHLMKAVLSWMYSTFQNSVPFDLLVNEISSQKFWYLSKIFLINWDIPIYQWLMNFQLALDLLSHYTWVAIKSLSLNEMFLSQSSWSSGQSGSLIQFKGFRIWVRICSGDKTFLKEPCRLTIENPPPRVSSMNHFFS